MILNTLTERLGIKYPIIQAPMASATTPAMVIAASEAGALGSLGAAYMAPDEIRAAIREIREATEQPFQVNLFAPQKQYTLTEGEIDEANQPLRSIRAELGISDPNSPPEFKDRFVNQLQVLLEEEISIVGFHFGLPHSEHLKNVKTSGAIVIACATRVSDAIVLEKSGVDIVVAQGVEAGGHQGTFHSEETPSMIGLMALIPQIVDAVSVPVIAAGGLMDGRGLAAALTLGASAGQLGTAFLASPESKAHEIHKKLLLDGAVDETRITRAFTGRPARGLINRMMDKVDAFPDQILPFPYQHALTGEIRAVAAKTNQSDFLSMWAGQGAKMVRNLSTGEIVGILAIELKQALEV